MLHVLKNSVKIKVVRIIEVLKSKLNIDSNETSHVYLVISTNQIEIIESINYKIKSKIPDLFLQLHDEILREKENQNRFLTYKSHKYKKHILLAYFDGSHEAKRRYKEITKKLKTVKSKSDILFLKFTDIGTTLNQIERRLKSIYTSDTKKSLFHECNIYFLEEEWIDEQTSFVDMIASLKKDDINYINAKIRISSTEETYMDINKQQLLRTSRYVLKRRGRLKECQSISIYDKDKQKINYHIKTKKSLSEIVAILKYGSKSGLRSYLQNNDKKK